MSSFEWMELQTLTADIATARARLTAARSKKDSRLVRMLESEIATAEDRRARLLSHITSDLADHPEQAEPAPAPPADEGAAGHAEIPAAAEGAAAAAAEEELPAAAEAAVVTTTAEELPPAAEPAVAAAPAEESPAAPDAVLPVAAAVGGMPPGAAIWSRLTPSDLAGAAERLRARRAETLARHAAELKRLAVERIQVEALEQAIDAFTRKFAAAPPRGAAVVQFEEAREIRAQGRA